MLNTCMFGEKMLAIAATINKATENASTGLRPYRSLIGPMRNCPTASPAMPIVSPIWASGTEQPKNRHMPGNAGVYISLTNEPSALSNTR